jgi:KUP system potassium uptake protein
MDIHKKDDNFEHLLMDSLTKFLQTESARNQSDRMSMAASWTPDEQQSLASMPAMSSASPDRVQMQTMLRLRGLTGSDHGSSPQLSEFGINPVPTDGDMVTHPRDNSISDSRSQDEEVAFLHTCRDAGVVYILGNNAVKARKDASFLKKLAINYIYTFLRRVSRDSRVVLHIPHECLLQVGMVYYV